MPRRISSASRKPSVVSRPLRAPVLVRVALVVTVVPCTIESIRGANASSVIGGSMLAAMSVRPLTTAIDGSAGVDSDLKIAGSAPLRVMTKSVKVPPTSMPISKLIPCSPLSDPFHDSGYHSPHFLAAHLAERGLRQFVREQDLPGLLEAGNATLQLLHYVGFPQRVTTARHDDRHHNLAPACVGTA